MKLFIAIFILILVNMEAKIYNDGQTWAFAEKNLLEEIQTHIKQNEDEINKKLKAGMGEIKKKMENLGNDYKLPRCEKDDIWYNDMRYQNPYQTDYIPKGVWIYPLKTLHYKNEIIIFNADEKKEIDYIKSIDDYKEIDKRYMLTEGKLKQAQEDLGVANIYFLKDDFQKRVKLKCTPSFIRQIGDKFEIREYRIR